MKRLILLAGLLFLSLKLVAQSFTYSGGGVNVFNVIAKADNGNSIVGGVMNSNGISQPFITKLDAQMQPTWTRVIPSLSSCEVYDILYDATSNTYWLAGTLNASQRRVFITKFDASGSVIFSKTYVTTDDNNISNPALRGFNKVSTGGQDYFVVTGFTDRDQINGDMLAFCIDTNGSVVWQKAYDPGVANINHANDAVFTSGNRLFITGVCLETSTVQIVEVNVSNGNLIQGANFDANGMYISIYDIVELQNGDLVAAGSYISNGVREAFAFCVNTNMDLIWQKRYYNTDNNPTFNIEIGSNGTVYINGFSTESNGDQNLVVLGVSPNDGSVITSKAYGKAGALAFESTGFHSAIIDGNDFIGVGKSTGSPSPQGNANGAAYLVKGDVTEQANSNCNAISANFVATNVPMNRNSGGVEQTLFVSALPWEMPNPETLSSIRNCGLEYECIVKMPNAFTPNDDNYNDKFGILVSTPYTILDEFSIYNRWGERLFLTNSLSSFWDGKVENRDCSADVYVYTVMYHCPSDNKEVKLSGDFTLMR